MTRLLVVGCGFPQLSLVRAARRHGIFVVGADANPRAVAVAHCDEFARSRRATSTGSPRSCGAAASDAVTTTGSEVSLKATAEVAARLGLPFYADPETVRRCQDKDAMRAGYAAAGVAVPPFARCEPVEEALAFARTRGFPARRQAIARLGAARRRARGRRGRARRAPSRRRASTRRAQGWPRPWSRRGSRAREYSVNGWVEDGVLVSYCVTEPRHRARATGRSA